MEENVRTLTQESEMTPFEPWLTITSMVGFSIGFVVVGILLDASMIPDLQGVWDNYRSNESPGTLEVDAPNEKKRWRR